MGNSNNNRDDTVRWRIPMSPWGAHGRVRFDMATEETRAKFRELYPVSFNKELVAWFGIGEAAIKALAKRLGLKKDLTTLRRRKMLSSPHRMEVGKVMRRMREEDPERFARIQRRKSENMRHQWRRARLQAEYGLPRTVRLLVTPLNKVQGSYKTQMIYSHGYFSDRAHPYWVCYDSQTARSSRMEAHAISLGLKVVEGEG